MRISTGIKSLTDTDPMPFGKYGPSQGDPRLMQDVPATYLHWLWHNSTASDARVRDYIKRNLNALRMENTDLIWL